MESSRRKAARAMLVKHGYKAGGRIANTEEKVEKGVHQHEGNMHAGHARTKLKLKAGGKIEGKKLGGRLDKRARGGRTAFSAAKPVESFRAKSNANHLADKFAEGGRTKKRGHGGHNIHIVVATPSGKTASPMEHASADAMRAQAAKPGLGGPPMMPPPGGMPPGGPLGMPPGGPPGGAPPLPPGGPGGPPGMPPGMPPRPPGMKRGGRAQGGAQGSDCDDDEVPKRARGGRAKMQAGGMMPPRPPGGGMGAPSPMGGPVGMGAPPVPGARMMNDMPMAVGPGVSNAPPPPGASFNVAAPPPGMFPGAPPGMPPMGGGMMPPRPPGAGMMGGPPPGMMPTALPQGLNPAQMAAFRGSAPQFTGGPPAGAGGYGGGVAAGLKRGGRARKDRGGKVEGPHMTAGAGSGEGRLQKARLARRG